MFRASMIGTKGMRIIRLGVCLGCVVAAMAAFAGRPPAQKIAGPVILHPIRAAQLDENNQVIGDWVELGDVGSATTPVSKIAYDNVEINPNTFPGTIVNNLYAAAPPAFLPGERVFFGPTYMIPSMVNDFQLLNSTTWGKPIGRVALAFFVNQDTPSTTRLLIQIRVADTYLMSLPGNNIPYSGASTAIVLDLGTVPTGGSMYRLVDFDLFAASLNLVLPNDGSGAVEVQFYKNTGLTQAANCQMMDWATRSPINTGLNSVGTNPSDTGLTQWDSDNPADLAYNASEFYSYNLGFDKCDPVGACVAFFVQNSAVVTGTVDFGQLGASYYFGPLPSSLAVSIRDASNTEVATGTATFNAVNGAFSLNLPELAALNAGFRISFKYDKWLRRTLPNPSNAAQPLANWNFGLTTLITGDIDLDDEVTNSDYALWAFQNGQTVAPGSGSDLDGDGEITNSDYAIWAASNGLSGDA